MRTLVAVLLVLGVALLAIGHFRPTAGQVPPVATQPPIANQPQPAPTPPPAGEVQVSAAEKRAEIADGALAALTATDNHTQTAAILALIKFLRDDNPNIRTRAADALVSVGRPALPALNAELAKEDFHLPRDEIQRVISRIPKEVPPTPAP